MATRLVFGAGALARLGALARELGFRRTLLVSDPGLGHRHRPSATSTTTPTVTPAHAGPDLPPLPDQP